MKSWYKLPVHLMMSNERCTEIRIYFYKEDIVEAYEYYKRVDIIDEKYNFNHFSIMYKKEVSELEKEIKEKNLDMEKIKNQGIYLEVIESKVRIWNVKKRKI